MIVKEDNHSHGKKQAFIFQISLMKEYFVHRLVLVHYNYCFFPITSCVICPTRGHDPQISLPTRYDRGAGSASDLGLLDLAGPAALAALAALVALDGLVVAAAPVALVSLDPQFVLEAPAEQASVDLPLQSLKLLSKRLA